MALDFEVYFGGYNLASYGFKVAKDGIKGLDEMRDTRIDIEWPPASNAPVFWGSELGERHITITGVVHATTRAYYRIYVNFIKSLLKQSLAEMQLLVFGDDADLWYWAIYDGTFTLKPIGSALKGAAGILTFGLVVFRDRQVEE